MPLFACGFHSVSAASSPVPRAGTGSSLTIDGAETRYQSCSRGWRRRRDARRHDELKCFLSNEMRLRGSPAAMAAYGGQGRERTAGA
ncbi:hypothetical protein IG631_16373 [Alternaria alternata]|nr:hypothetical protein IG631_16373 [Alternaria alternata]